MTKSVECEMWVNGTRSRCVLVEYITNDYYARFHYHSYHSDRETHFRILSRSLKF